MTAQLRAVAGASTGGSPGATPAQDPAAVVRKLLEEHAPCETGYPGKSTCRICIGGHECADALEATLSREHPDVEWAQPIRDVLGLW